jgi:hypothetical protein
MRTKKAARLISFKAPICMDTLTFYSQALEID